MFSLCKSRFGTSIPTLSSLLLVLSSSAEANVVGSDFQTFNPTTNGLDFVTVQSARTLKPGVLNLGLFLNYAYNSLPSFEDDKPVLDRKGSPYNSALFGDLNLGLGLASRWDIGLSLPSVISQAIHKGNSRIQYSAQGFNEVRLNTKFRFLGDQNDGIAAVLTLSKNLIQNNPYVGEGDGINPTLELAGHLSFSGLVWGLNVGHRWRNSDGPVEGFPVEPFKNQLIYSTALSYYAESIDTNLISEIYAGTPLQDKDSDAQKLQQSAEFLFGAKHDVSKRTAAHFGASVGLKQMPASPDARIYAGVNHVLGPLWSEKREKLVRKRKRKPKQDSIKAPVVKEEIYVMENVHFKTDSATEVLPGTYEDLKRLTEHLEGKKWTTITIEGHTDSVGDDAYNLDLSQRRSDTIRNVLGSKFGLDVNRIGAVGYGETKPASTNSSYQGRQLNRRVEVKIEFD